MAEAENSIDIFAPTEYTAMINLFLSQNKHKVINKHICEIGTGNGIIAANTAILGAARITVSDLEIAALSAARSCINSVKDATQNIEYLHGPLWEPYDNQVFDLILANLPHFPGKNVTLTGRLPTWSSGGSDGRKLLDPFIEGITRHLTINGLAVFTHNRFVGLDKTRDKLKGLDLTMSIDHEALIFIPTMKAAYLTNGVDGYGDDIVNIGRYTFGRVDLIIARRKKSAFL